MNRYFRVLSLLALFTGTLPALAQECSCAESFEQVVQTYENDYSLFNHKVTEENRKLYNAYTEVFRARANEVDEIENCLPVLEQWLQFFRDGHNRIAFTGTSGKEHQTEQIEIDRKKFKSDYKKKGYQRNDLLGIWQYGAYEVALLPKPGSSKQQQEYVGVILSSNHEGWKPGDVKFRLKQVYGNEYEALMFMDDYSGKKLEAKLSSPYKLQFKDFNYWAKVWPTSDPAATTNDKTNLYSEFHIRLIDGEIPYIRFPNFYEKEPAFVDSLLKAHHEELVNANFIVVDVRDNAGGSDAVYKPAMPYLLSGPVQMPTMGIWVSEGNLKIILKGVKREDLTEEEQAEYDFWVSLKNSTHWLDPDNYSTPYSPDTLFAPDKKVAVLINENTISSGETFVYRVMQSDKVVLYGQNTAGIVDGFMVFTKSIDCFELRYPSSFRAKDIAENPVDPYGFEPDVYLSPEVDALQFSIDHMKQLLKEQAQ